MKEAFMIAGFITFGVAVAICGLCIHNWRGFVKMRESSHRAIARVSESFSAVRDMADMETARREEYNKWRSRHQRRA